jgi:hypothetical protein
MSELSYCGKLVYEHDRDRFLLSLFATGQGREAVQALYALDIELMHVAGRVSEPVIGQMRLAWWQETLDALYAGQVRPGQPVLEALQPVVAHMPKEMLMPLVEQYRERFPQLPDVNSMLDTLSLQQVRALCPEIEPRWCKARDMIAAHRRRYGMRRNGWMSFRLLIGL